MRRTRLDQDSLLSLVGLAYDAALDPARWSRYLTALSEAVAGRGALLIHHNLRSAGAVVESVAIDPQALALYNRHYHAADVWAISPHAHRLTAIDCVAPDQRLVPRNELTRSEFYGDFVSRFDLSRMVVMALAPIQPPDTTFRGITVFRGQRDAPFGDAEVMFLQALAPHVRQALQLHDRLAAAASERRVLLGALDALPCAVFVVDGLGAVLAANSMGERLSVGCHGMGVERGTLLTASVETTRHLRRLSAEIADRRGIPGHGGGLAVRRPSSPVPLQVFVAPVSEESCDGIPGQAAALVFVTDPLQDRLPSQVLLRCYYGLTKAEAEIGARIAVGRSLEEIAVERGLTIETVRWYNKQVLAKTGSRTRAEMVRRVSRSLSTLISSTDDSGSTGGKPH